MSLRETNVEKKLVEKCKRNGAIAIKGENVRGFVDRIVFNTQRTFIHWVEIKNNTYYGPSVLQKEWRERIEKCGGTYFLIDGEEDLNAYLKKYIIRD